MKFTRIPFDVLTQVPNSGMYMIFKDAYWAADDNNNLLFYGRGHTPQCNTNEIIAQKLVAGESHPGTKVIFVPCVYIPAWVEDYAFHLDNWYGK